MLMLRRLEGKLFQTVGTVERKLRLPNISFFVARTMGWLWCEERSLARPTIVRTGVQTTEKYTGHVPQTQLKAIVAILYVIRWLTGSQKSTSPRVGVICSFQRTPVTRRAAASSTDWNFLIITDSKEDGVAVVNWTENEWMHVPVHVQHRTSVSIRLTAVLEVDRSNYGRCH